MIKLIVAVIVKVMRMIELIESVEKDIKAGEQIMDSYMDETNGAEGWVFVKEKNGKKVYTKNGKRKYI